MLDEIKRCNIIYGYVDNCIQCHNDSIIILVEPRKRIIDKINKLKLDNVIIIKKVLVRKNNLSETILYYDKINDNYWLDNDDLSINGTNFFNIKLVKIAVNSMEEMQFKDEPVLEFNDKVVSVKYQRINIKLPSLGYAMIANRINEDSGADLLISNKGNLLTSNRNSLLTS
jgi:hypothetical protein